MEITWDTLGSLGTPWEAWGHQTLDLSRQIPYKSLMIVLLFILLGAFLTSLPTEHLR